MQRGDYKRSDPGLERSAREWVASRNPPAFCPRGDAKVKTGSANIEGTGMGEKGFGEKRSGEQR
jgi:hypothetical protein